MSTVTAKEICKLQGIDFKLECKVICPYCTQKQMILKLAHGTGHCINCKTDKKIDEILRLSKEKFGTDHRQFRDLMQERSGIQL